MQTKQILNIAIDIGYMVLKYGGEIYRVEQTVKYICNAYGVAQIDVFAIPTSIVITLSNNDDEFITKTKRVMGSSADLNKVNKLNDLSRYICKNKPEYDEIKAKLNEIENSKSYPVYVQAIGYGLVSLGFAEVFGGCISDTFIAFFIGALVRFAQYFLTQKNANDFLKNTFCSFMISALSFFIVFIGVGVNSDHILIGTLMVLVPGVTITNCMRDFMANDYTAGVTKFSEAIMSALSIALGVAIVLFTVYGI